MKQQSRSGWAVYRRLLSYVKPFRAAFALGILGNILYGVVDSGFVKLLEPILNRGFVDQDQVFISLIPFIVVGIFIIRGMATFMSTFFMGWVARNVVMQFRQQIFAHILNLPCSYFDKTPSGELLSKITFNVEQVAEASSETLTVIVREVCTALGLMIVMLSISWRLTLLFIVMVPLMAFVMHVVSNRLRAMSLRIQDSMGGVTHYAQEAIEAHKVIKMFGGQQKQIVQFAGATNRNRQCEMKMIVTQAISVPLIQVLGSFALAATIFFATKGDGQALISPGGFAAMIAAMIALLKPIKQLTKVNSQIQRGIAGAQSIFQLLDEPIEKDKGTTLKSTFLNSIEFQGNYFSYEPSDTPVLSNLNLSIAHGETLAVVGRSGSGKSSLVSLLPRFYDCIGPVCIDGVDIQDIPLHSLRELFAIVSQQVTLFNDTIANNICYGQPLDDVRLEEAARSAHAVEFIEKLPDGFETSIGENGVRLSGGQRQRIAIARAIYKKAPILILDEATSSLDTESERVIQKALEGLMQSCTTIVIAHRLSTIEKASRIIVMDQGKIVQQGTHKELVQQGGIYAKLLNMQSFADDAVGAN